MAFPTVAIFSASSSGISTPNSSSRAMTSSTVSSESAPRSFTNEASGFTSPSGTPSCSAMIFFTFASTSAIVVLLGKYSLSLVIFFEPGTLIFALHIHAAVHVDHLARDVRSPGRGEEPYRVCHVLGRAELTHGYLLGELLP